MKRVILPLILLYLATACYHNEENKSVLKEEVLGTEKDFASMAANSGITAAFLNYADENAVLQRNGKLIKGKTAIKTYFESQDLTKTRLQWSPDFAEVSLSGDMAYTYGTYTLTTIDEKGIEMEKSGVFHTVWKKQPDDTWKFVWD
jgi:ketosteroid isomerase-like protein